MAVTVLRPGAGPAPRPGSGSRATVDRSAAARSAGDAVSPRPEQGVRGSAGAPLRDRSRRVRTTGRCTGGAGFRAVTSTSCSGRSHRRRARRAAVARRRVACGRALRRPVATPVPSAPQQVGHRVAPGVRRRSSSGVRAWPAGSARTIACATDLRFARTGTCRLADDATGIRRCASSPPAQPTTQTTRPGRSRCGSTDAPRGADVLRSMTVVSVRPGGRCRLGRPSRRSDDVRHSSSVDGVVSPQQGTRGGTVGRSPSRESPRRALA